MATNVTITSNFTGTTSTDLFVQLFKSADTIGKGLITLMPNVIGVVKLPKLTYSADFVPASCGWNPQGAVNLSEKEIVVKDFEIKMELCKKDFANTFQAQTQGLFSANAEIPSNIKEAILLAVVENAAVKIDNYIWNSTTTGLFPQFEADASVVKITGATISKANVVAEIEKVYDQIIPELDSADDVVIVVSRNVAKAYKAAQASMGQNTTVGDKELDYMGQRIESVSTYPNDRIVAYRVKNVHFGFGLESDSTNLRLSDDESRLDGMVRIDLNTKMGQGYIWGGEIVYYRK